MDNKIPPQVWATILACMGVLLAVAVLYHKSLDATMGIQVLTIASNLVSGALGAFAGHEMGAAKAAIQTGNAPVNIDQRETK